MYRINCPANKNYQIRARGFDADWIWGSGTYDRADMVFTFAEVPASQVQALAGFDPTKTYNIFSYGTQPGSGASVAGPDIQRRYLFSVPAADGRRDSVVYRIGLAEQAILAGSEDPLAGEAAALWTLEADGDGLYRVRNEQSGAYLVVDNYLSATPAAICPRYAKHDNNHAAYFLEADATGQRLFNVGKPDADGNGGPLDFFALHADRTRLRWVILPTAIAPLRTDVRPAQAAPLAVRYFNLQGIALPATPRRGLFIEQCLMPDGSATMRKRMIR
jgi:hypothetical protein